MKSSLSYASIVSLISVSVLTSAFADGTTEVSTFSIFPHVETARLEKGADSLVGAGIQQHPGNTLQLPGGLSGQALFIINTPPARVQQILLTRNPAKHKELNVWVHEELPLNLPVTPASFSGLLRLPSNPSVQAMVDATASLGNGGSVLQLSKDELRNNQAAIAQVASAQGSERIAAAGTFWSDILSNRVNAFLHGGLKTPALYFENGDHVVKPLEELHHLFTSDKRVENRFSALIARTPFAIGAPTTPLLPGKIYYECFDENGQSAIGAGAMYSLQGPGSIQVADIEYYANYGTYVLIGLYEIWPIDNNGKPASLVWRGDFVTSPQVEALKGTEKMAGGLMMLQDVKQDVGTLRSDIR